MLSKKLLTAPLLAAVLFSGAASPDAHAAKSIKYEGKTKEGTEMSFTLNGRWVDNIAVRMPTSCVSAQGGARAHVIYFLPPFKWKLGTQGKATDDTSITRHYFMLTKGKAGKAISGKMSVNWSELSPGATSYDMKIWECLGTVNFKLKPKR